MEFAPLGTGGNAYVLLAVPGRVIGVEGVVPAFCICNIDFRGMRSILSGARCWLDTTTVIVG